jgi:hypothetical protein
MPKMERIREALSSSLDLDYLQQRIQAGWRLVAIEWERESNTEISEPEPARRLEEVPFGLRVAGDCVHLEENPTEMQVLKLMMELIVQDLSLPRLADELNQRGFRTRQGTLWNAVAIFNTLTRLVEVSPRILSSDDWLARRKHLTAVAWNS